MPSTDRNRPYQEPQDIDLGMDLGTIERKNYDLNDGNYLVELRELSMNKPDDESKNPYLWAEWEIVAAEKADHEHSIGFKITDVLSLSEKSAWKIASMMDAIYGHQFEGKTIPKDVVGKRCVVYIAKETYKDNVRSRIKKFKNADKFSGASPAANGGKPATKTISGKEEVSI